MRFLIDTHSFLWFGAGSPQLSQAAQVLIGDPSNQPLLSMASLWEIAIKLSVGKLRLAHPFATLTPQQLGQQGIIVLNIQFRHLVKTTELPLHHRDPFDRLLVAQALVEQLPIISADSAFDAYGVTRLW